MSLEDFTFLYNIKDEMFQGHLSEFYKSKKLNEYVRLGRVGRKNPNLKLFYIN